jgi:hypothetical protein
MRVFISCVFVCSCLATAAMAEPEPRGELIFPRQDKHCHGSSIVQCLNGDFLPCWFFGSDERSADDVEVRDARLKKGATAWEPVFHMADTPGFPCAPTSEKTRS